MQKITNEHLNRYAIIYIRQSTLTQLNHNHESRRRQYDLVSYARSLGFGQIKTIDEDLGKSGSGLIERPGFQQLVTLVCSGEVGAVFCLEASRLARNGREWHHLIELCGLIGALVIDSEGIYDPCIIDDRLLLGLKSAMSEFELSIFRQRSVEAIRSKAARGELQFLLPVGMCWSPTNKIELDPNLRVQNAIHLIFQKFREFSSARQTLLWLRGEKITLPSLSPTSTGENISWKLPIYGSIIKILTNPIYAGAYAFGKTEKRVQIIDGKARKTEGHRKAINNWTVLIHNHHPGYISWEEYQHNQKTLAENLYMKNTMGRKSARGGQSLLVGLLRCGRCGRMLQVTYSGSKGNVPRYNCRGANINHGEAMCISVGGLKPDQALAQEILRVVEPFALESSLLAAQTTTQQHNERQQALQLELEQANYEAQLAARRYETVDPHNRLVALELESRWNLALERVKEVEKSLESCIEIKKSETLNQAQIMALAKTLPDVWNNPKADQHLKQQIVRILIQEIIVNIDEKASETVLIIHWSGGSHSELRLPRNKPGKHRRSADLKVVEIVRQMAGKYKDEQIAAILNRLGMRTGAGNTWNQGRVCSLRHTNNMPAYNPALKDSNILTLQQAADKLDLSTTTINRLIEEKILPANQIVPYAPWQISIEALQDEAVQSRAKAIKTGKRITHNSPKETPLFSLIDEQLKEDEGLEQ